MEPGRRVLKFKSKTQGCNSLSRSGECGSHEPVPYQSVNRRVHDPRRPQREVARDDELEARVGRLEADYADLGARVAAAEASMRLLKESACLLKESARLLKLALQDGDA